MIIYIVTELNEDFKGDPYEGPPYRAFISEQKAQNCANQTWGGTVYPLELEE